MCLHRLLSNLYNNYYNYRRGTNQLKNSLARNNHYGINTEYRNNDIDNYDDVIFIDIRYVRCPRTSAFVRLIQRDRRL